MKLQKGVIAPAILFALLALGWISPIIVHEVQKSEYAVGRK